ncbi:DUF192 domain-containing protein [Halopseudomonas salegens]|uniref:DUF192 domain-containing protein n=1 Tax=Halopseudomonas salegens TaxID=1434072 RepID=A0A1H2HP87_9GAMM|nr:DUF192 domain-containing protein [Halopseudomonas salegens]SDU33663.1 hypothetical protein SAMN05216210_3200 [Halopseudomonas salegens]
MKNLLIVVLLVVNSLWISPVVANPEVSVVIAGKRFQLEYVADLQSRRQGLMGRESLPDDGGMLFDFPQGTQPQIWMRNMQISLDLLYVDNQGHVVDIFAAVPPCSAMPCPIYPASRPLRFVVELPAGSVAELGLESGMQLIMPEVLQRPVPLY